MRNMSFSLTTEQILQQTKDVTRRTGWAFLNPGTLVQPVEKAMGLKAGEAVVKLGLPVRCVSRRREPLSAMLDDPAYGKQECLREGFPDMTPEEFVAMFCKSHAGCTPASEVTRIEFEYLDQNGVATPARVATAGAGEIIAAPLGSGDGGEV